MSTLNYKCPCCGSSLNYSGVTGKLECSSCGNAFETEDMEAMNQPAGDDVSFDVSTETFDAGDTSIGGYHCKNCGAELICEATTTATECPYCGSPTILPERILGGVKPDQVVPFLIPKEQATNMFHEYFKGKKLLPNVFVKSTNEIREIRKLYVPYWLFDCDAKADIVYDAEKDTVTRSGEWEITKTAHYAVRRAGTLGFDDIPVNGSAKMEASIAESLEPYDLTKAVPFQSAVLSGALADNADVAGEDCKARAIERVKTSTDQTFRSTVSGYNRVSVRRSSIQSESGTAKPVLMPVWMITTSKQENGENKLYTFAINGQSGKLTCNVPYAKGKFYAWLFGIFAVLFAIVCGVLYLADSLASGTALIGGVICFIIALASVMSMAAKLKTAVMQSAAANYIRKGSFNLIRKTDSYLYTTETRRKIETNKPAQQKN